MNVLYIATASNWLEGTKLLIESHCPVLPSKDNNTLLHVAVLTGNRSLVQYIVDGITRKIIVWVVSDLFESVEYWSIRKEQRWIHAHGPHGWSRNQEDHQTQDSLWIYNSTINVMSFCIVILPFCVVLCNSWLCKCYFSWMSLFVLFCRQTRIWCFERCFEHIDRGIWSQRV